MNAKQAKLLNWFGKLEQFAGNENLPLRLIDSIADLRKQVSKENRNCHELYADIENLLDSIGQKVKKDLPEDILVNDDIVSVDEVRRKITETIERGHRENLSSVNIALHGNHAAMKECYRQMSELTTDKTLLKKIGDGNHFLHFFQNVKQNYEKNATWGLNDFAESVNNNCSHMIERVRSMCRSIDGYKLGLGEEEFYIQYDESKEGWDNQLLHKIESADLGGNVIMDFAQETLEKIQKIIRNYRKKRNLCIFLPPLILLICALAAGGFFLINKQMDSRNAQANAETVEANAQTDGDEPGAALRDVAADAAKTVISDVSNDVSGLPAIIITIVVLFIISVIYIAYFVYVIRTYKKRSLSACGECLQKEYALFEKEDRLSIRRELENILTEHEKQYLDVLNNIFSRTALASVAKDNSEYKQLLQEWNTIQRMQEGA